MTLKQWLNQQVVETRKNYIQSLENSISATESHIVTLRDPGNIERNQKFLKEQHKELVRLLRCEEKRKEIRFAHLGMVPARSGD